MISFLRSHPFAVEAFFENVVVFTYAVEKELLSTLIPPCLELDTFQDQWAFITVAMVQTKNLRPKGFPKFLGNDFFLIGYRIFVRYKNTSGRTLRGLYILQSETDSRRMKVMGNLFTHYNYQYTDVTLRQAADMMQVSSKKSDFSTHVTISQQREILLPRDSPFTNWQEARKFAGPMPFTFTYQSEKQQVLIIEGVRQDWKPLPLCVKEHRFSYIEHLFAGRARLANAFMIKNVPYHWQKGKIEPWQQ